MASYLPIFRMANGHPTVDRSEVLLVSDSIPVTARNTAGREYKRRTLSSMASIAFMTLLKITLGGMWATLSRRGKRNLFNRATQNPFPVLSAYWLLEHKAWTPGARNARRSRTEFTS